jgi:hypothetical protein
MRHATDPDHVIGSHNDFKEVVLQTAVHAGASAANTGFRIAAEHIGTKGD